MKNEVFISDLQMSLTTNYAPLTVDSYNREIRYFLRFIKNKALDKVETSDAVSYMRFLTETTSCHDKQPLAPKTIKRKILSLYSIYDHAIILDLVLSNPFLKAAKIARNMRMYYKRPPRALPFEDVPLALMNPAPVRDKVIYSILFGGGLRVSEVIKLRRGDIFKHGKYIGLRVQTAKTRKREAKLRAVTLPEWATPFFELYMEGLIGDILFPSEVKKNKKPLTRKRISDLCFLRYGMRAHSARHTHASFLLSNKVPIVDVAKTLGHASIQMTTVYDQRLVDFDSSVSKEADYFFKTENSCCKEVNFIL